jgi:hypothetical protein
MNIFGVVSSGAIGIVIGWLAREIMDWFKRKEAHRSELQKRFFDERLAMTLKAMQMMKTSSSALRSMLKLIQGDIAAGGNTIDAGIMANTLQNSEAEIKRVAENAAGAVALLRFFHGDRIATRADDAARTAMVPIVQKITVVFSKMTALQASVQELADEEQEPAFARAVLADADLQAGASEALRLAEALDERADEIVRELREVYKPVFGFGYD